MTSNPSRDEAMRWIINNQLGRRNITEEQKSALRGRRYQLEKKQGERKDLTSPQNGEKYTTAERLAGEFKVSKNTIQRDAEFVEGLDTLEKIRDDLPQSVLTRKTRMCSAARATR